MPDSEKLIQKILDDAKQKENEILKDAEATSDSIIKSAREEADQIWEEYKNKAKEDAKDEKKRFEAISKLEHRKAILFAKQKVIHNAFKNAKEMFANMSVGEYEKFILDKVVEYAQDGEAKLVIADNDKSKISSDFIEKINDRLKKEEKKANITMSDEARNINSGFILIYDKSEINATIDALIEDKRQKLENEIVSILFK